jgi:membrane-associated phospholipid phosphatase
MLLWAGIAMIVLGLAAIAYDRRIAHLIYDRVDARFERFLFGTTHLAKAAFWLAAACLVWAASFAWMRFEGENAAARLTNDCAAGFILALGLGSAVLHAIKLLLGRRRPRDEIEMGRYGFLPLAFDLKMNSFPSGHSLTITIVAVFATALWPWGGVLWFAAALWLSLTRALVVSHFLSDVLVGAGVGLISAHVVLVHFYPQLSRSWF